MKRFLLVTLILPAMLLMFSLGCEPDDPDDPLPQPSIEFGEMTDARDGKTYKTIGIGTQTWMAENLNYTPDTGNSWCYNNDANNCNTYGRLYDWNTAMKACPSGWHLPSDGEWTTLTDFLGSNAGGKMKSTSGLWTSPNTGATNASGWSGLPGGHLGFGGFFSFLGSLGYWWSSAEFIAGNYAWSWSLCYRYATVYCDFNNKGHGFSVRCIRD